VIGVSFSVSSLATSFKFKVAGISNLDIHASEGAQSKANIIAIIGGKGLRNQDGRGNNFLIRQRVVFFDENINFYLLPNRSSRQKAGYQYRASRERLEAIWELVKFIKRRNNRPIFIVGFSRGTVDAGAYSKTFPKTIDGVVLASGIYTNNSAKAVNYSMEIIIGNSIDVPILIAHHSKDECSVTRYKFAKVFFDQVSAPRKNFLRYIGGIPSGRGCGPFHHHGFEGIERQVALEIADWILFQSTN